MQREEMGRHPLSGGIRREELPAKIKNGEEFGWNHDHKNKMAVPITVCICSYWDGFFNFIYTISSKTEFIN